MKNLIKKNQLMITALAIMLAIAGYLQFAGNNLEDESYMAVDNSITEQLNYQDLESLDSEFEVVMDDYLDEDMTILEGTESVSAEETVAGETMDLSLAEVQPEAGEIPGEAVFTSANGVAVLSEAKMMKEQVRAKNKETLLEIINSDGLTDVQKQAAVETMVEMTSVAEKETAAEILLQAKGFDDVVVSINDDAVDVVVNLAELTDVQRAQIEDIVKRKTEIGAESIVISTVSNQ
ncbi:MAG: SpoIIIAH-like family protein [Lachnospiraceae bacterium]|nr:SpoIIIAH-like family protein [Lachnospiraceae bacterium]